MFKAHETWTMTIMDESQKIEYRYTEQETDDTLTYILEDKIEKDGNNIFIGRLMNIIISEVGKDGDIEEIKNINPKTKILEARIITIEKDI